jgi:hypothetical protein
VDGYCKLEFFGIEIYAGIDAYSRYIVWFYVGVSARTARNVFAQYVKVLSEYGFMPLALRSDYGVETTLLAGTHYYLSSEAYRLRSRQNRRELTRNPPAQTTDHDVFEFTSEDNDPETLEFEDCFIYGDGTKNVKIERWWGELCQGRSLFWRVSTCSALYSLFVNPNYIRTSLVDYILRVSLLGLESQIVLHYYTGICHESHTSSLSLSSSGTAIASASNELVSTLYPANHTVYGRLAMTLTTVLQFRKTS